MAYQSLYRRYRSGRFGELGLDDSAVVTFAEKPQASGGFINGGFFVFERRFLDYVGADAGMIEADALQKLTADRQLGIHVHDGFWRGMDTYREYVELNNRWEQGDAPWKRW